MTEGVRLLSVALHGEGLSLNAARLQLGLAGGVINHWIRGTRKPDAQRRSLLLHRFGIPFEAWDALPSEEFDLTGTDHPGSS